MESLPRVEIFGGARIVTSGRAVPISNARASVLLAALVLARGAVVSLPDLRALLWPSGEPASATNQLHRLVGQVRRAFEPDLSARDVGSFVAGSSAGYRLDRTRVRSDLDDCDAAVDQARRQVESNAWDEATDQFLAALVILQHPLLGDATWEASSHSGFSAASRTRVAVASEALACARRGGRLDDVVTLVDQIASPLPFEEVLQADLISALAQAGRRRDAMFRYDRVRTALADELGVDPGPELRAAYDATLRADVQAEPSRPRNSAPETVPVQLPAPVRGMTDRPEAQKLLNEIAELGGAEAVVITAIGGMGGIGKTTLAVAWARSLAHRFPDGQLYVNLRGFDPEAQVMSPMDALGALLLSLGVPKVNVEESLEARSARFRTAVTGRKLLFVLDNARDAAQVRPLLPDAPGCLVVVTSRNQLASLVVREGAVPVRLDRMTNSQALELLTLRLGAVRLGLEPAAVERIIEAAAGLPLALAIVAARLALDPALGLEAVANELTAPPGDASRLSGWSAGEEADDLASVFDWSYHLLDQETARLFRCLAVHPGSDFSLRTVASIGGHDLRTARQMTSRLVGASLLDRRGPDRFVIHDLLREYADSRLGAPERRDAEARLVGHYVRSTRNAWALFGRPPVGDLDDVAELTGIEAETFDDIPATIDWYQHERTTIPAVLALAVDHGRDRAAANIAIDWRPMNQTVDLASYTYPHALAALEAANRLGDPVLRAELHRDIGMKAAHLGDEDLGQGHLDLARTLYAQLGDSGGEANTLRNLSSLRSVSPTASVSYLRAAIALAQEGEVPQILTMLKVELASRLKDADHPELASQERYAEAEALLMEALAVMREEGWTYLMPLAAASLADVLMRLSRPREALDVATESLPFTRSSPFEVIVLLGRIAEAALACGERSTAARACRDFWDVSETHGRDYLEDLLTQQPPSGNDENPWEPIARVEAALVRAAAEAE